MPALPTHSEPAVDNLREAFFRHSQELLAATEDRDDAWRAARACLHQRGFDLRKIEHQPLGYFPAVEPLWKCLLHDGFAADEIRASNLLADSRLPGRLIGPIRGADRRIESFWARQPQNLDRCLYLSTEWKEQTGLFGLDVALPAVAGGRRDLIVVEDIWDSLLLQSHGWAAVGAIGNSPADIGPRRWERLDELGIHRVTLLVDSFHDSHEAAVAAIRQAAAARRGPAIYVLPPAAVHGAWQSWQQGRAAQPDVLEKLLAAHRIHGYHYLALGLIALAKGDGIWTDASRRAALSEGRKFFASAHQRNVPQLDAFFLPPLLEALDLNCSDRAALFNEGATNSWLEDAASANGSEWSDAAAKAAGNSYPLAGGALSASIDEQSAPKADAIHDAVELVATAPRTSDFCDFHQCDRIVCLCWD